ncbi:MAG: Ada metal-binding domain-containing protein, partial [Planctomycetota bacterium]
MTTTTITPRIHLPAVEVMYRALCERDSQYDGLFFFGVRTTGVFCRTVCPARKPKLENVDFYRTVNDALSAGFRPCKKCRPLEAVGAAPAWLRPLLAKFEEDINRRWTDDDIRRLDVEPVRVRRWFKQNHGMTFHGYMRSRRLSIAMGQIQTGRKTVMAAVENGFESISGFNAAFKKWSGLTPSQSADSNAPMTVNRILTPLGPMVAAVVDDKLCLLEFADRRMLET